MTSTLWLQKGTKVARQWQTNTYIYSVSLCLSSLSGGRSSVPDGLPIALEIQCSKPSARAATPKAHLPLHAVSSSLGTRQPGKLFEHTSTQ